MSGLADPQHLLVVLRATLAVALASGCDSKPEQRPASATPSPAPAKETPQERSPAPTPSPSPQPADAPGDAPAARVWSFDDAEADQPPSGFSFGGTGLGPDARWVVLAAADAPSGDRVLAQTDATKRDRFATAVIDDLDAKDVAVEARCKPISGKIDRACGLVVRYRDEKNYYVSRANALENNIRLYTVVDGKRSQLASWDGPIDANTWHTHRLEARGSELRVVWNGEPVIEHDDSTFTEAGAAGVWIKADSVTQFDDLTVDRLDEAEAP